MLNWWVDGHFICADSAAEALERCRNLYDYAPESVRPWTLSDWDYCPKCERERHPFTGEFQHYDTCSKLVK